MENGSICLHLLSSLILTGLGVFPFNFYNPWCLHLWNAEKLGGYQIGKATEWSLHDQTRFALIFVANWDGMKMANVVCLSHLFLANLWSIWLWLENICIGCQSSRGILSGKRKLFCNCQLSLPHKKVFINHNWLHTLFGGFRPVLFLLTTLRLPSWPTSRRSKSSSSGNSARFSANRKHIWKMDRLG